MKIVVGGQIDKNQIADKIRKLWEGVDLEVKSDLEAAMSVKNGNADCYIGACNTGGGGALGMAIALVGRDNCSTLSMPGKIMDDDQIRIEVQSGKKAFGFTAQHQDKILPILISELKKKV